MGKVARKAKKVVKRVAKKHHSAHMLSMGDLFGGSKKPARKKVARKAKKVVKVARKAKKVVTRVVKKTNVPAAKAAPLKANKAVQNAKKVVKPKKTTKKASPIHEDDSSDNESEDNV